VRHRSDQQERDAQSCSRKAIAHPAGRDGKIDLCVVLQYSRVQSPISTRHASRGILGVIVIPNNSMAFYYPICSP
jgi:hypothetical protein